METDLKAKLKGLIGEDTTIREGHFERELCSTDISAVSFAKRLFNTTPELVSQPKSVGALIKTVQFANDKKVAVFPRGSASSGLGGVIPTVSGIVLDLSFMNKIIQLNKKQETLKVQAGVRWSELEDFLSSKNLSVRAYPSSFFSTVGGWIATGGTV